MSGDANDDAVLADICNALRGNALAEHNSATKISASIDLLRKADLLSDGGAQAPSKSAKALMRIAGVNLSVARLYEGHINALRLVELHGSVAQRERVGGLVENGAFLGVWGADAEVPLQTKGGNLCGAKKYASGLGTVTNAVVSIDGFGGRIGLVDVTDAARQDASGWAMPGMRATQSGTFEFTGMPNDAVDWIGPPGCYMTEPGFVGGVWRIAALQLGGTIGLLDAAAHKLRHKGRISAEAQLGRLAPLVIEVLAAEGLVFRAADFAEGVTAITSPERGAVLSASARLLTEEIAQKTISVVERSVGLSHFEPESETGRIAADLAVYLRQAARDAFLIRVGSHALADAASVWEILS